jgi:hypothetical protein
MLSPSSGSPLTSNHCPNNDHDKQMFYLLQNHDNLGALDDD